MKTLILIRGLSGAGKSDLANIIVGDGGDRAELSVDEYFYDEETDTYNFNPLHLKEAHEWCEKECASLMEDGIEVMVVHNVFSRKWEIDPYIKMGSENGYRIHVVNLYDRGLNDIQLSRECVHNINPGTIQRQRKRWDKDVYREKSSRPFMNSHHQQRKYRY